MCDYDQSMYECLCSSLFVKVNATSLLHLLHWNMSIELFISSNPPRQRQFRKVINHYKSQHSIGQTHRKQSQQTKSAPIDLRNTYSTQRNRKWAVTIISLKFTAQKLLLLANGPSSFWSDSLVKCSYDKSRSCKKLHNLPIHRYKPSLLTNCSLTKSQQANSYNILHSIIGQFDCQSRPKAPDKGLRAAKNHSATICLELSSYHLEHQREIKISSKFIMYRRTIQNLYTELSMSFISYKAKDTNSNSMKLKPNSNSSIGIRLNTQLLIIVMDDEIDDTLHKAN